MPKLAAPPPVAPETWRALLAASADFAALAPWDFAADSDPVGLIDPVTGEARIGHVLGNAGEVFAAVLYRRIGLRWILAMISDSPDIEDANTMDGMDALKVEFVPKHELSKEDLALLKAAGFKSSIRPTGKATYWPQFRSTEPGWHPWYLNQAEANQLLADLPRLTAFCKLFGQHPELFEGRDATEIPFLPEPLPDRPLTPADLDWHPLLLPPITGLDPFPTPPDQLEKLRALVRKPGLAYEFDCTMLPGGSFIEEGRPCFGRHSLLVEGRTGLILGAEVQSGALAPGEAAGRSLVNTLLQAKSLPETIFIRGPRLQPALQPLCDELQVQLHPTAELPALDEAVESLSQHLRARGR